MNNQELLNKIKGKFPSVSEFIPKEGAFQDEVLALTVPADILVALCADLKADPELAFDGLMCLSGVDYKDRFEVLYHLYSYSLKHKITLKVTVDRNNPVIESVVSVWNTANWHEREACDMFGIKFNNHPNLIRILLPDGWDGHPLRKDYAGKPDKYD